MFSTMATTYEGRRSEAGVTEAFAYPGFVPAYIRPLFCRGVGPFRWAVLSGDPEDIAAIDGALRDLFPDDVLLQRWLELASRPGRVPGAPRSHLLARATATAPRPAWRSTSSCGAGR